MTFHFVNISSKHKCEFFFQSWHSLVFHKVMLAQSSARQEGQLDPYTSCQWLSCDLSSLQSTTMYQDNSSFIAGLKFIAEPGKTMLPARWHTSLELNLPNMSREDCKVINLFLMQ